MFLLSQIKENLIGMTHGGTLNKIRSQEALFERAASNFLLKCKPLETMRTAALTQTIHDDVYNYALPSDYNSLIDLIPQDNRGSWDNAYRKNASEFDLKKAIKNRTVSIEGSEGSKIIRINWRSRSLKVLNTMNSYNGNGTWVAVGTATGIETDEVTKKTGSGSVRFDLVSTGDGISNIGMTAIDMTDEDEVATKHFDFFIKNSADLAKLTSVTAVWGNDITTAYWTATAQTTQSDGTAFKVGWNTVKFEWSSATETGTVIPSAIDSAKITFAITGTITNMRIDNITFSIGRNFDMKYYSKYFFKSSAGVYLSRPSSDDDYVLVDNDSLPLYLYECLIEMAQQMEGVDSMFDMNYAEKKLSTLFPHFRSEYPDQRKKTIVNYGGLPRFNNSRRFH
jgi:hypothetical protein